MTPPQILKLTKFLITDLVNNCNDINIQKKLICQIAKCNQDDYPSILTDVIYIFDPTNIIDAQILLKFHKVMSSLREDVRRIHNF